MSLIHEALKKAEQQRRLGEPPNLGTPFATTRRRRSLLPYLAVAIAGVLGAGWWLSRDSAPDTRPDTPAQAAAPAAATPATATTAAAAANGAPAGSAAERRPSMGATAVANTNVVGSLAPPPPLNRQSPPQDNPVTVKEVAERESEPHPPGANPLAPGEAAPLALGTPPPETLANDPAGVAAKMAVKEKQLAATPPGSAPAASAAPAARKPPSFPSATPPEEAEVAMPVAEPPPQPRAAPAAVQSKPQAAAPAPPPAAPPALPAATASAPPAVAAASPATPAAAAPLEQLPAYWQLPYNVRKELPALKLSMHVYSATPEQRFVVLNGNRQVEGDELGGEVRVAEIRRDGVVLSFQGQRFLVPRGGS